MGVPYYLSSGASCYRASVAKAKFNSSLTIGNNGPRSCTSSRSASKPKPTVENPAIANGLKAAARFDDGCSKGISVNELRVALGAVEVTDATLPGVKLALTNALKNEGPWAREARTLAKHLVGATSAADYVERQQLDLVDGLDKAAASGQGITKPELSALVKSCFEDGTGLSAPRRALIRGAVQNGKFARQSTAHLALSLTAKNTSQAEAGAIFGFSR